MTMMLMMMLLVMALTSHRGHSMMISLKTWTRLLNRTVVTDPLETDLLNAQMVTVRDFRMDPGVDLAAGCTKGHRVPHPMTRFILKIEAGTLIIRLTGVITIGTVITGTVLVMMRMKVATSMVFPLASMVNGVTTKGTTTGTD